MDRRRLCAFLMPQGHLLTPILRGSCFTSIWDLKVGCRGAHAREELLESGSQTMKQAAPFLVIVGCGRLGSHLATRLDREGCAVRMVDRDAAAFSLLPEHLAGACFTWESLDLKVLQLAGITEAGFLIATTSKDDLNVALGLVCRKVFGTDHVLARVRDPRRADSYARFGIEAVCPTALVASAFQRLIEAAGAEAGEHEMRRENMKSLYTVIVGCGRLGSHLANLLSREGHQVVVIDRMESAFSKLSAEAYSGFRVEGDASEPSILRSAKIAQANLLIAATHEDNVNLMVALVAKRVFGVRHVMARVYDPAREPMYRDLGVETVCPTLISGEAFFKLVYRAIEGGGDDA